MPILYRGPFFKTHPVDPVAEAPAGRAHRELSLFGMAPDSFCKTFDDKGCHGRVFVERPLFGFDRQVIRYIECCSHADILLRMQMYVKFG